MRGQPQTARLIAGEQRAQEAAWDGALQDITGYSTDLVVVERATLCPAVQPFQLAIRSVLLHEGPASLSGDERAGKARLSGGVGFTFNVKLLHKEEHRGKLRST